MDSADTIDIILGSSSPFRKAIFHNVTDVFETRSPNIDEKQIRDPDPYILTRKIAHAKADAILKDLPKPTIVITADQVVFAHEKILEKPESIEQAKKFIKSYSNSQLMVINGIVAVHSVTGQRAEGNGVVTVLFGEIPDEIVERLLTETDAMKCAGGIQVEHDILAPYIIFRDGEDDCLQGIPVDLVKELIKRVQN